jgi:hypothetical protein
MATKTYKTRGINGASSTITELYIAVKTCHPHTMPDFLSE